MNTLLFAGAHLLVSGLPVIAAMWGMLLALNWYEWTRYRALVQGARCASAGGGTWIMVHFAGEDECAMSTARSMSCAAIKHTGPPPTGSRREVVHRQACGQGSHSVQDDGTKPGGSHHEPRT